MVADTSGKVGGFVGFWNFNGGTLGVVYFVVVVLVRQGVVGAIMYSFRTFYFPFAGNF